MNTSTLPSAQEKITLAQKIRKYIVLFVFLFVAQFGYTQALTVVADPACATACCQQTNPCSCMVGVIASGGLPPYTYTVFGPGTYMAFQACLTGVCPGTYIFEVRDAQNNQVIFPITIGGPCCKLTCKDTTICFDLPDSLVVLPPPTFTTTDTSLAGGGTGQGPGPGNIPCSFDSLWNNSPGVFPVGTTVVTWYVLKNGVLDSCTQNIIRNPPSPFSIIFSTSPPIIGGVINICNGQSITFVDNSTGTIGRLWNFGNGFYSTNQTNTQPGVNYPPGTYFDTLTVYDACGTPHDTAFMVVVDTASGPDIFCISVVCPGDTVTYHTNAICTNYTWSVTNGFFFPPPTPTSDSVTVVWGPGPQGTISLSVSGCTPPLNCPNPTVKTVHIVPATLPIDGDTIVCAGSESCYEVDCIPGNNYSWEILPANAGVVTGNNTCRICVQWAPGFFGPVTIQLNYQNVLTGAGCNLPDQCAEDPGCGGTASITVDVRPIFGISGPTKVCPNTVSAPFNGMNLTNNTIASGVSWKLVTPVPSVINFPNSAALNAYTWNAGPGTYCLTAYAPPNVYCNDSAKVCLQVVNMLQPNPIVGPDTVCANVSTNYAVISNMSGVTYVWTVTNGVIVGPSTGSSVNIQWNPGGGTVSVVQMLSAAPFCASISSTVKTVVTWPNFPLPVVTASAGPVCINSTITYSFPPPLLSNATYTWSVVPATAGNIVTANGTNTISIKWISGAITPIFVKLKISRCYEDSVMVPITLLPLPTVPNITYFPANPCVNTPVNFSTTNVGPTWNWDFGDAGTAVVQNPTHTYTTAGNYNVELVVTNASGCSDTANTLITVEDIPVVPVITGPDSVCINSLASYTFSQPLFPGAYYSWSLSNAPKGIISSSGNNLMNLTWTTAGIDTVKVRVQATCLDTTIKYVVVISPNPSPVISVVSPACQNSNVNFSGSGGATYSWIFAGGSPGFSSSQNPVVTYAVPGTYNVSLTVVSAAGCSATTTTTMVINPEPLAIINGPFSICAFPGSVTMNAVAQPGYTFLWSPTGTSGPSVTTTINSLTTFSCVVTNSFGCTKLSNSITVDTASCTQIVDSCQVNDSIDFTYTPPICLTQQYTKIYTGTLTGWNFGAGGSAGAITPVSATYPYPGVFPVTVVGVALGTYPDGSPCNKNISRTRNVTIPFDLDFDFDYQCNGSNVMQVIFTNTSQYLGVATSYNWTWYDATYAATLSTNPFPPALTLAAGTHVINFSAFDPATGATCLVSKTINVPVPISASFTVSSPLCVGAPNTFTNTSTPLANVASLLFNNGNGGTATTSPVSIPYALSGNHTASIAVTDIYGCTATSSQLVTVTPAGSGTITVGALACDSVSLTASGPGPFTWNVIVPPPFPNNPAYVKTSGFYSVTGIGVNGCPYTFGPVQVTVKKSPTVTITGNTNYCQGENLNIKTPAAGVNYAWIRLPSTPVGTNSPNLNIVATLPGTFTYQVTVTAANGCTGSATYVVTVDPVPSSAVIVASGPLTFCQGDSVCLSVNPPGSTYLWSKSPTPPLSAPSNANSVYCAKESGTYSVIVQTANGCAYPSIAPVVVTVNPKPVANITGDTVLCEGETLSLLSTPVAGATYAWTGPAGTGVTNPFVFANMQLSDAGQYSVIVTNSFGCTQVDTINVIVNPSPVNPFIISNPGGVLCEGQVFNLSIVGPLGPPIVYNWSTGQMGTNINVVLPNDYWVTATNQFGCSAQSNIITVHPRPDLSCVPGGCYEFCDECDSVSIPGPFGLFNYDWQVLVGNVFVSYTNTQNMTVYPPGGKFRLMGSNQWGCADSSDTLNIEFNNCCPMADTTICADTCVTFDNNTLMGWQPFPGAPNVGVSVTNVGSQGGPSDYFVMASDLNGPSQLEAGFNLLGKWCCGEFCFDYKMIDDGVAGAANVNPTFRIFNGTLGFVFTSSTTVTELSPWQTICAPITDCNPPPTSPLGVWAPIAGTTVADWTTVLSNVTNVLFRVDYTAALGETSGFDNVCINSNVPDIDAGNDTTICVGAVVTLHVEGCNGMPEWYEMGPNGLVFVGNGPIVDVMPTQTTCYVVTCCGVGTCCCDTDTVCINVNPLPILQWNTIYPSVCQNSAPIVLDSSQILVYVNNNWVPLAGLGGSGFFSGPFVTGNIFTPSTIGTHTICYTYTDSVGCTNTVCNTINVIFCCDTTFQISAGSDTTICHGGVATLNVTGCNGGAIWYALGPNGPVPVGQGPILDALPTTSTCYMVVCCDPIYPTCCDTDTVCVFVNPLPVLQWNTVYPDVCQNSAPIVLDSSQILVYVNNNWVPLAGLGGSGFFSGPGVVGNVFTPTIIGPHTICYTYTDSVGCTATVCNTINVIFCCDTTFQISAGNDTTICLGGVATFHLTGCNGGAIWYALGPNGPVPVGQGEIFDAFPTTSTCYIVVCCNPLYPTCCDTDTVCVFVNELPILQWNTVYPDVCQNSAPIVLDSSQILVYVNNNWVPLAGLGGSGFFSGPFVTGNIFTPSTIGTHTICYTYTDSVGCTNTVCNTINVIFCCDTTFQISAGNDTTICIGGVATLNVTGCNGGAIWYALGPNGPVPVGQGEIFDAFPTTSTCYIVVCCNPLYPTCCDTDTVCVFVNPLPVLQWNTVYPDVCQNSAPIVLDSSQILVYVNNNWVPLAGLGGSGFFSGPFVTGNIFTPSTIGTHTICYTYTDSVGCTATVCNTINVIFCCDTTFQISAGNDTTICLGGVATFHLTGCNGGAIWYALGPNGPVPVGQGEIFDAFPTTSTCYIVVCCNPLYPTCCDTDTVCVFVNPLPVLQWNTVYPVVCQNSAPIVLDSSQILVYVNNNWVPLAGLGGSGFFSGPGVVGNVFTPTIIGPHTICYTYTDSVGCTATVCNTINVIFCCDTTLNVDAGNDTTICAGGVAILQATGCNGAITWYTMGPAGLEPAGQGPIFDAFPQTSTCYVVICCDPLYPACCDTDTVCVFVNPHPILQWVGTYPDICVNAAPIVLDSSQIQIFVNGNWVSINSLPGSGFFSGIGVVGNVFTPSTIGNYTICYTYTDSAGCSATVCNFINVIFCCDTTFQISAGNDTTICAGNIVTLQAQGCVGNPTWYILTGEGPVPVVQGQIFDVSPQVSTCYMVVCCDPMYPACCDTDTVCVFVNPLPILSWPSIYTDICYNGGPINLNPNDVFVNVNNTWIMSTFAGGTGVFSGPGVFGNTFTPPGIGSYVITFTYTDANGCVSTITNSITTIFCCDTTFQISAGNDTTVCAGNIVTLQAQGCVGNPTWYILTGEGPVPVVQGQTFDVSPQVSTCYMVVCCNPLYPACCDTDTVCVFVNPLPVLSWPVSYAEICYNGGPITLDPTDIWVYVNNAWVVSTQAGGTGFFSGPGVFGNTFTPPGIGSYVITFTYTDANGCVSTITNSITSVFCCDTLSTLSAGNDTTICAGGVAILEATGCNGVITWYTMGPGGLDPVGQGPIFDAFPQTSTCYVVICCNPLYPACCDTDTVCVFVNPQPILSWPVSYAEICYNGGPIPLDPNDIWVNVNNAWVVSTQAGGTGFFSGPGVLGNTFTPPGIGSYVITFTYIDANGCVATITNSITAIFCCDTINTLDAGNDTTICAGGVAILTATGCDGIVTWYKMSTTGLQAVGQGPIFDATPLTNTCYIAICCNPLYPTCCDTDTVCVNVIPIITVGPITGTHFSACLPAVAGSSIYFVPAVQGATYLWTVPAGMTISSGQGTSFINTTWTAAAMQIGIQGQVCVTQILPCGTSVVYATISIHSIKPVRPGTISGPTKLCPGDIATFSVAPVPRASFYVWTVPAGMTITSGAGTNVITVSVGPGYMGGTLSVVAGNSCGVSPVRIKALTLNVLPTPGPIIGPASGLCNVSGAVYSIVPVIGANSYIWSVTNGTIVGSFIGTSILVNWNPSFTTGTVSVYAINGCGISTLRTLTVTGPPAIPVSITGPISVCINGTYQYSTPTVSGASHYSWQGSATIIAGQGTKVVDVLYGPSPANNQFISVSASNGCGTSAIRNLSGITVSSCLRPEDPSNRMFTIYPNPVHDQFELFYQTKENVSFTIEMLDTEGRLVNSKSVVGNGSLYTTRYETAELARGVYLMIVNEEGSRIHKRVVVY